MGLAVKRAPTIRFYYRAGSVARSGGKEAQSEFAITTGAGRSPVIVPALTVNTLARARKSGE